MSKNLLCTDNMHELIAEAKKRMIEATNIESDPKEMAVIDNILFRIWQMGWLDKALSDAVRVVRCEECRHRCGHMDGYTECDKTERIRIWHPDDWYCADGKRREEDAEA